MFPYSWNKHWVNEKYKKHFSLVSKSRLVRIALGLMHHPEYQVTHPCCCGDSGHFCVLSIPRSGFCLLKSDKKIHTLYRIPECDNQNSITGGKEGQISLRLSLSVFFKIFVKIECLFFMFKFCIVWCLLIRISEIKHWGLDVQK